MNHRKSTLVIAAILVAVSIAGVAFAIPQQVLASYGHHRHNHNNNSNNIKVDQQIGQVNSCTGAPPADSEDEESGSEHLETEETTSATVCLNTANNTADIHG